MAIKTVLIDDFDGTPLSGNAASTTFSINGVQYEIDLAPANVQKLKDALAPFVKAGRRVGGTAQGGAAKAAPRRRSGRHSNGANDVTAIRAWAQSQGLKVGDCGRIPAEILAAYAAAH